VLLETGALVVGVAVVVELLVVLDVLEVVVVLVASERTLTTTLSMAHDSSSPPCQKPAWPPAVALTRQTIDTESASCGIAANAGSRDMS